MKPTSCLINVARGKIVEEPALIAALQSRQVSRAALDAFEAFLMGVNHHKALETLLQLIEDEPKEIAQHLAEDMPRFEDLSQEIQDIRF